MRAAGLALLALTLLAHPAGDVAQARARSACERGSGLPPGWRRSPTAGMAPVAGALFTPGSTRGYPEERPGGALRVGGFWIDRTEVTNAQFAAFVAATGYRTIAERTGVSAVFTVPAAAEREVENAWWKSTPGASWRHPAGPGSDVATRPHHPVVHVTREDALAYAGWLGHDLPTEAEWELAARDGSDSDSEPRDSGGPRANYWQGEFPSRNSREDGYLGTAPVGCFPANRRGLRDLIGNVWEWTRDPYLSWAERTSPSPSGDCHARNNAPADSLGVIKGGSHLCARDYCVRFRAAARHAQEIGVSASHLGFRTVYRPRRND